MIADLDMALQIADYYFEAGFFDSITGINTRQYLKTYANAILSDGASDTIIGARNPSRGFNYLAGNGGNDNLISNSLSSSFLVGSSDFSATNGEIDILIGSSSARDHFYLSGLYRGSGFAVIKNFQPARDFLYISSGSSAREEPPANGHIVGNLQIHYNATRGIFNNVPSTFINYASNGDRLAVIEGYSPAIANQNILANLFSQGALRLT